MDDPRQARPSPPEPDGDGIQVTGKPRWAARVAWLMLALVAVLAGVVLFWRMPRGGADARNEVAQAQPHDDPAHLATQEAGGTQARPLHQAPPGGADAPGEDPTPDLSDYVPKGQTPTMPEVIDRLHQAGIHSGLGAFNPPGTSPPLVGLAVPDDYALPQGYVRHYQATDDGQRIEPILMYSPDYRFFDAAGHPIPIPDSRVVPPDRAPPGLPIRQIAIPPPIAPRRP